LSNLRGRRYSSRSFSIKFKWALIVLGFGTIWIVLTHNADEQRRGAAAQIKAPFKKAGPAALPPTTNATVTAA
jgi:hypothetical protein